jgi:hypothetical protein
MAGGCDPGLLGDGEVFASARELKACERMNGTLLVTGDVEGPLAEADNTGAGCAVFVTAPGTKPDITPGVLARGSSAVAGGVEGACVACGCPPRIVCVTGTVTVVPMTTVLAPRPIVVAPGWLMVKLAHARLVPFAE